MAEKSKSQVYWVPLGGGFGNAGSVRYAWMGRKNLYKNIAGDLGVVEGKDTDEGLVYGCNSPNPAKVRIYYRDSSGNSKSTVRFCQPDNINKATTGGALKGKKVWTAGKEYPIYKCELITG
jgi:hypothetical protein